MVSIKDTFSFCGTNMLEAYGVRAVTHDVLLPRLRPRKVVIAARDGAYDFGAQRYEERIIRIECESMRGLSRKELREMAHLLSQKGRLVLWDEPDKHYLGRLYEETGLSYVGRIGHLFTLSFVCEPFALGRTIKRSAAGEIRYEGTAETPTVLTIRNEGQTTVRGIRLLVHKAQNN